MLLILFSTLGLGQQVHNINPILVNRIHISKSELAMYPGRSLVDILSRQSCVSYQNGDYFIEGTPLDEISVYIDGVYYNTLGTIVRGSIIPLSAIYEINIYPGTQSTIHLSGNSGRIDIISLSSGDKINFSSNLIHGIGKSGDGISSNTVYSYGDQQYDVSISGPLFENTNFLFSYEYTHSEDINPSVAPHYRLDRTEIEWGGISKHEMVLGEIGDDGTWQPHGNSTEFWTGNLTINSIEAHDWQSNYVELLGLDSQGNEVYGYGENDNISFIINDIIQSNPDFFNLDEYLSVDVTKIVNSDFINNSVDNDDAVIAGYHNLKKLYGAKLNTGFDQSSFYGKISYLKNKLAFQLGMQSNKSTEHLYDNGFSLINAVNNPKFKSEQIHLYSNILYNLTNKIKITTLLSYNHNQGEFGDHHYWNNITSYGVQDDYYHYYAEIGYNPSALNQYASYSGFGTVWDKYYESIINRLNWKSEISTYLSNHHITMGVEAQKTIYKKYSIAQPMEAGAILSEGSNNLSSSELFNIYRNAYTDNIGFDITGNENKNDNSYESPGRVLDIKTYFQDEIQFVDLHLNIGCQWAL